MRTACFTIFFTLGFSLLNAQIADTTLARVYLDSTSVLIKAAKYNAALELGLSAKNIYETEVGELNTLTARAYGVLTIIYRILGKYDKSLDFGEKSLAVRINLLGKNHLDVAKSYASLGYLYKVKGNYIKALDFYQKALEIRISVYGENHFKVADAYTGMGVMYKYLGDYNKAFDCYAKSLKIYNIDSEKNQLNLARVFLNIGVLHKNLGDYSKAIEYYNKTLKIRIAELGNHHPETATVYNNLGNVQRKRGNYDKSILLHSKALDIDKRVYGENHPSIGRNYTNIASLYLGRGDFEKCIQYQKKSLEIEIPKLGANHPTLAASYGNLGLAHQEKGDYVKALEYNDVALQIALDNGAPNLYLSSRYTNRGTLFGRMGDYDNALKFHKKALELQLEELGENNSQIATSYHNIGMAYRLNGEYEKSLKYLERALSLRVKFLDKWNPEISCTSNMIGIVYSQIDRPNIALKEYYHSCEMAGINWDSLDIEKLEYNPNLLEALYKVAELQSYDTTLVLPSQQRVIQVLHSVSEHYANIVDNNSARIALKEKYYQVYETTLELAKNWTPRNKEKEFSFVESSKSTILLNEVKNTYVDGYRDLPDSLQNKDSELKIDIAYYEKKRYKEENKSTKNDSLITTYNNEIFTLKREQDELMTTLQQDYPDYYQLKYDNTTATVEEIQELLTEDQALVEYFVGDSTIFIFTLTPTDYEVTNIKKDFPLEEWVSQVRDGIYLSQANEVKRDSFQQQYAEAAYQLHEKIIAPIPIELPQRLIIVPDGALGYLPFDALLQSKAEGSEWKTYDYLLRDHAISYNYSATLYQQICAKDHPKQPKKLLAVAPSFGDERTDNYLATRSIDELRDTLTPLKYNLPEVAYLYETIGGDTLIGQNATMSNFQQMAKDYQIVHLSTHGKANDQVGDYSYLAFTETKDSIENEKLYVRDLYNLKLNADMVVLSACETGLGELKRGEGIIGMTRGFMYAGTKSIITSLWKVDDSGTKEMMGYFYDNLRAGMTKDVAMQQAKLKLLDRDKPEPFYWASFTPIGDMEVLDLGKGIFSSIGGRLATIAVVLLLTLFGIFYYRKSRS